MIILRAEHGPAGATTLIVSLGFMTAITSLVLLIAGVATLAVLAVAIDRLAGLNIPFWSGPRHQLDHRPIRLRPLPAIHTPLPPNGNGYPGRLPLCLRSRPAIRTRIPALMGGRRCPLSPR